MAAEWYISVSDIQVNGDRSVAPSGSKLVASFNWSSTSTTENPHIIVPGEARIYNPPSGRGFTLGKEYGDPVVETDKVGSSDTSSPRNFILHSLGICSPSFDMDTVDIVTERSNLRNLQMFCGSPGDKSSSYTPESICTKPFRFLVHGVGDNRTSGPTLVFSRMATGQGENYPGYARSFANKLTKEHACALPDAESFSAVVEMNLDGLSLLVRSNVDACETPPSRGSATTHGARNTEMDLSEQLDGLRVSSGGKSEQTVGASTPSGIGSGFSGSKGSSPLTSGLTATKSGELLGDDVKLLTFKSKNKRYAHEINWEDYYWRMALGGSDKLVLGLHNCGRFDGVQQLRIDQVKARAEETGSSSMVYLSNALREIIKAAHYLMAAHDSTSGGEGMKGPRPLVVVEYLPPISGDGTLRVRVAVPGDGVGTA